MDKEIEIVLQRIVDAIAKKYGCKKDIVWTKIKNSQLVDGKVEMSKEE